MSSGAQHVAAARPFYGKPFSWLLFGWLLFLVPVVGYLFETTPEWARLHPALNAVLNASSAFFLLAGRLAIARGKNIELHKRCMIAAVTASSMFLVSYVVRFALTGAHRYPGHGWDKALYFTILFSHMILATAVVPLAARTFYLGLRRRDGRHRRISPRTWALWMYVSVTGVVVYLMLYPIANAVYGG